MTRLEIQWPDESEEAVRAARGRIEIAGEDLASRSFEDRLRRVVEILELWTSADSPWRRELGERLGERSGFDRRTLEEGLDSALRAWDPAMFADCARREIAIPTADGRRALAPYASTSVLAGGPIPMPTLLSGLLPLVLGSPVLLRSTNDDAVTGELLARSIAAVDAQLAECFETVRFAVEDEQAMAAFLASPCVVATGSDETMASIRARLSEGQRFVAYGHRFSVAVLGPEIRSNASELARAVDDLARDVARWDQLGCLSPIDVYLVGLSPEAGRDIAARLADALDGLSRTMPRGPHTGAAFSGHALERAEARMRAAVAGRPSAYLEGNDFAVSLEADATARPAPLFRCVHLLPLESIDGLTRALSPLSRHLSTVAAAGFDASDLKRVSAALTQLGVSRVCAPGRMQTPPIDWPRDGRPLFVPLARFVRWDAPIAGSSKADVLSDSDA